MKRQQVITPTCMTNLPGKTGGATLMEILVTVIVLSIGLLGVAGLQFNSLRGNHDAMVSSQAVMLVAEGADRLRANVPGVEAGVYDNMTTAGSDPGCTASACTPQALANHDAYEWISKVANELPSGIGVICKDSTPDDGDENNFACDQSAADVYAVKVFWDHDHDASTPMVRYSMSLMP